MCAIQFKLSDIVSVQSTISSTQNLSQQEIDLHVDGHLMKLALPGYWKI